MNAVAVAAALAVAALPGCALVSVDADIEEACVTRVGIEVPAATGVATFATSFTVDDLGGLRDLAKGDGELQFLRFTARATSGAPLHSLAGVTQAEVTIGGAGLAPVVAYDCTGECPVVGPVLEVPPATAADAADYLASGSLAVDVAFTGTLPDRVWTMDAAVCVSGQLSYAIGP